MSGSEQTDIWQVDVNGQVYEAAFGELPEWIAEGSLLPTDRVRKGNLRWVSARHVPTLVPFFNAKERGEPMPMVVTTTEATESFAESHVLPIKTVEAVVAPQAELRPPASVSVLTNSTSCSRHPDVGASFSCSSCSAVFCKACPRSYGGSVKICPECGQLCKELGVAAPVARNGATGNVSSTESFGIADMMSAFAHPLRFKSSLILGGGMFAAFSLGQSVSAIGGIMMMVAALFCMMLANTLSFGVLSHTVDRFAQGDLESDFMPSFEDFSIWDNVVHPFFLSIAAYLVSFGPFLATLLVGLYLVVSSINSFNQTVASDLEKIPGTDYYAGRQTAEQSAEVKEVLTKIADGRDAEIENLNNAATGQEPVAIDRDAKEQEELWEMAQQSRREQLESTLGKTPETRQRETQALISGFLGLAAPLVAIGAITFLWGSFFFPAASAVAGYTRSVAATINPLVGLDTIRRLGVDYVKILAMCVVIAVIAAFVSGILAAVLSPLDLPGFGNLPAKAISSFFGFYFFTVFSCILGCALFKSADRLQLPR